jgi:hypothetical protein
MKMNLKEFDLKYAKLSKQLSNKEASKMVDDNGHEFNEVNTIFQKNNKRRCRICDLEWRKINYKNKKQKHEL